MLEMMSDLEAKGKQCGGDWNKTKTLWPRERDAHLHVYSTSKQTGK